MPGGLDAAQNKCLLYPAELVHRAEASPLSGLRIEVDVRVLLRSSETCQPSLFSRSPTLGGSKHRPSSVGGLVSQEDAACSQVTELALNDLSYAGEVLREAVAGCEGAAAATGDRDTWRAFQASLRHSLQASSVQPSLPLTVGEPTGFLGSSGERATLRRDSRAPLA